jgi:ABC-2 type transport system permease protein
MSVMSTTFSALAMNLTALREQGILKRMRGTPLPSGSYLAALAANAVTNAAIQIVIVVLAGKLFFGIPWPRDYLELVVFVAAGVAVPGLARRRVLPRHPELRLGPGLRERRLPAGHLRLRRLLRRRERAGVAARHRPRAPLTHLIDGLRGAMVTGASLADNAGSLGVIGLWTLLGAVFAVAGSRGRRGGLTPRPLRAAARPRAGRPPRGRPSGRPATPATPPAAARTATTSFAAVSWRWKLRRTPSRRNPTFSSARWERAWRTSA